MREQSGGLYNLIARSRAARDYFAALPDGVRQQVSFRAGELSSLAELQSCAQELLSDYD